MDSDDNINNIIKVYLAQMDSAIKISEKLCDHSDRSEITGDDIICGLIYRLMRPMSDNEMTESLSNASLLLDGDGGEDEDEYEDEEDVFFEIPKVSRKIKSNNCNCETCVDIRVCLLNYNSHEPLDELAQLFKNSIVQTCDKYKIFI